MSDAGTAKNTDREIWREREGDFYADSIHVTEGGSIGINCGGTVRVMPVRKWHEAALKYDALEADVFSGGLMRNHTVADWVKNFARDVAGIELEQSDD